MGSYFLTLGIVMYGFVDKCYSINRYHPAALVIPGYCSRYALCISTFVPKRLTSSRIFSFAQIELHPLAVTVE